MAEIWGVVAAGVVAAGASSYASKQAGKATSRGTNASINEQARQYDQTRSDFAPSRTLGTSAINTLNRLYGYAPAPNEAQQAAQADVQLGDAWLPAGSTAVSPGNKGGSDIVLNGQVIGRVNPGGANGRFVPAAGVDINALRAQGQAAANPAPAGPDMGAFIESPDYQYNLAQQEKAIKRQQSAGGASLGGRAYSELQRNASGAASGQYSDFTNRLLAMAGLGQAATTATAGFGANAANNIGAAYQQNAANRAQIGMNNAANINNAFQGGVSNILLQRYLQPGGGGGGTGNPYGASYNRGYPGAG